MTRRTLYALVLLAGALALAACGSSKKSSSSSSGAQPGKGNRLVIRRFRRGELRRISKGT